MVDVYSTEPERQAALQELTALRRELKTETAKGAKAAQSDPRFIAAQARLDAAKSAAGMRTRAEDLAFLNKTDTEMTAKGKNPGQVTERLNQRSERYFAQVQQSYENPDMVPTWKAPKQVTPEMIKEYAQAGELDASNARFDWIWSEDQKTGKGRWVMGLIGVIKQKPADLTNANQLDIFYSDSAPIAQARKRPYWGATWNGISLDELEEAIPEITFSQFQELHYRLTLERDEDITIEDILDKYDEMYGG
jgi:hypothetical protein